MGQTTGGRAAGQARQQQDNAAVELPRLDLGALVQSAGVDTERETRVVELPGGASVVVRGMTRGEFVALGIDQDSDAADDEARIVAATVAEPAATPEQWREALAVMSPGAAGAIISACMQVNGLGVEVGRNLARDFRP